MGFVKGATHPALADLPPWQIKSAPLGCGKLTRRAKSLLIFRNRVKPLLQKYFASRLTQIRCISKTVSFPPGGAYRDRHGRWGWDAVDARASGARGNRRAR